MVILSSMVIFFQGISLPRFSEKPKVLPLSEDCAPYFTLEKDFPGRNHGSTYFIKENYVCLIFDDTGFAVRKKDDTHRMAEANRAFAHFAW